MTYAIQAEGLTKSFGSTRALDGVDLALPAGTVLGLLGPNGAGKTTAVRILATLLRPDGGTARVAGHDIARDPDAVRRSIGLTGQYASVDEMLTGRENLELFGRLLGLNRGAARARAAELLADFGLSDAADRRVKTYSGGMRRRLDLGASLVARPAVIFLDEPTTGLDPAKREDAWEMVRRLTSAGTSVLLTTQYLEEAEALADSLCVIDHGRVIAAGTPAELKQVVGERTLQVRPTDPDTLDEVALLLAKVAGAPVERPTQATLTVPADDTVLARVVGELAARRIAVSELSLALPTLDEVFLTLTGRPPVTDQPTGAATTPNPLAENAFEKESVR